MKKEFTTEELTSRWEDVREIENLMGRRSFYSMIRQDDKIWKEYWCKKAPDPCLGFNDGYYKGYEALEAYFKGVHDRIALQTELIQKAKPEKLGGKSLEEIFGVGSLVCGNLTTPLIELAEDGQTAKGLWYVMGEDAELCPSGPICHHSWGRVGVDFVKEDGAWKIWHMVFAEDIWCPTGTSWGNPPPASPPEADPRFAALADFKMPEPNVPMQVHELYHEKRPLKPFPALPVPYATFADTFSYGI